MPGGWGRLPGILVKNIAVLTSPYVEKEDSVWCLLGGNKTVSVMPATVDYVRHKEHKGEPRTEAKFARMSIT